HEQRRITDGFRDAADVGGDDAGARQHGLNERGGTRVGDARERKDVRLPEGGGDVARPWFEGHGLVQAKRAHEVTAPAGVTALARRYQTNVNVGYRPAHERRRLDQVELAPQRRQRAHRDHGRTLVFVMHAGVEDIRTGAVGNREDARRLDTEPPLPPHLVAVDRRYLVGEFVVDDGERARQARQEPRGDRRHAQRADRQVLVAEPGALLGDDVWRVMQQLAHHARQ